MKIAVCDNEAIVLEQMKGMIAKIEFVNHCEVYSDLPRILQELDRGEYYDVIIMDIDWQAKQTGIDAVKEIKQKHPDIKIIYLTGYTERFVQQIFLSPANLSGFLAKPVDEEILKKNLVKILGERQHAKSRRLPIKYRGSVSSVYYGDILYLESNSHTITVHTRRDKYKWYERLENTKNILSKNFCHCHKSYIVNMDEISKIEKKKILLNTGAEIPVSKMRYRETKERYFRYMQEKLFEQEE